MCDSLAKSIILATANSLAPLAKTGRPRVSHELLLDQFIRVLRTGTTWRDVKGIDFRTAHRHFLRWAREGIFEAAYRRLHTLARRRRRDGSYLAIDTSFVKNVFGIDAVGRNPTDRGRKATKVVALVDDQGLPHRLGLLPANIFIEDGYLYRIPTGSRYEGTRTHGKMSHHCILRLLVV